MPNEVIAQVHHRVTAAEKYEGMVFTGTYYLTSSQMTQMRKAIQKVTYPKISNPEKQNHMWPMKRKQKINTIMPPENEGMAILKIKMRIKHQTCRK